MSSTNQKIQVLNNHLSIVSYNGGPLTGINGLGHAIHSIPGGPERAISSHNGSNFDIVLKYTGPAAGFTLTHVAIRSFDYKVVTAPLKTAVVWVHPKEDVESKDSTLNISRYSSNFNNYNARKHATAPISSPAPATIVTTSSVDRFAIASVVKGSVASGKYIHVKLTERHGDDVNIDFGPIFFLGYEGTDAPAATATTFDATPADYDLVSELNIMPAAPAPGRLNAVTRGFTGLVGKKPIVTVFSTVPVAGAVAAVAAGTASKEQTAVADAVAKLTAQSANNKHIVFLSVDPSTPSARARELLAASALPYDYVPEDISSEEDEEEIREGLTQLIESERVKGFRLVNLQSIDAAPSSSSSSSSSTGPNAPVGTVRLPGNRVFEIVGLATPEGQAKVVYHQSEQQQQQQQSVEAFVSAFATAFQPKAQDILESLGTALDDFESAMAAASSLPEFDGTENESKHADAAAACSLARHVAPVVEYPDNKHPIFPNVKIIQTPDSFDAVLIGSAEPVLLVTLTGDRGVDSLAAHSVALAGVLAESNINVTVALMDITVNKIPSSFKEELSELSLFVKKPKADKKKKGKGVATPACINKAGLEVFVYDLIPEEEEEDEDEEENAVEKKSKNLLVTTQVREIMNRVPNLFPSSLKQPAGKALMDLASKREGVIIALSNSSTSITSFMKHVRVLLLRRARVEEDNASADEAKLSQQAASNATTTTSLQLEPTSQEAMAIADMEKIQTEVQELLSRFPFPLGKRTSTLQQPCGDTSVEVTPEDDIKTIAASGGSVPTLQSVEKEALGIYDRLKNVMIHVNTLTSEFEEARDYFRTCASLLSLFPAVCVKVIAGNNSSDSANKFLTAYYTGAALSGMPANSFIYADDVVDMFGGAEAMKAAAQDAETKNVFTSIEKLHASNAALNAFASKLSAVCEEEAEKTLSQQLGSLCPRVHNDKEFMRALDGYVSLKPIPSSGGKAKSPSGKGVKGGVVPGAVKTNAKVPFADQCLIVFMFTNAEDGVVNKAADLADVIKVVQTSCEEYMKTSEEAETKPQVVLFYRVKPQDVPECASLFNLDCTPAFCFVQQGVEVTEFRSYGLDSLNELPNLVEAFFESTYEDEDDEEDEDFTGICEEDEEDEE